MSGGFGSASYAKEELVALSGQLALLLNFVGVDGPPASDVPILGS
jgi:hypothetical protein